MRFEMPEGATPIADASGLKLAHVLTYSDLCAAEAENILAAAGIHLSRRKNPSRPWFNDEYIRKVHRDMFGLVWEWAGMYKTRQTNFGVPVHSVREEIAKLCQDVVFWENQDASVMPVLERAVRIHHRLCWIHAFPNGNGRHARMMADIYLYAQRHSMPVWPKEDALGGPAKAREEYLRAMRQADQGNFKMLLEYTARYL